MSVCLESCKTKFYFNAALSQMCGRQAVVTQSFVSDTCVDLYFALFFTASGWLAARSLTSLSATAQSVCYHPLNDTFCLWWVRFLYWNQYAQRFVSFILFLHIQARQTVALWWKSCFVLFFVGTNKYNLCQGCLRGSMWVTFAISARLVHRTLGLWRQTTPPPISFWWCSLLDDR